MDQKNLSQPNDLARLSGDTGELALMAARLLARELSADAADTKRARELSGILKDMALLARELRENESRELTVTFLGGTEEMSK